MADNIGSNRERFKRLAPARTNNVLRSLKILGNCGNRGAYDYTDEEVAKIFREIEARLKQVKGQFTSARDKEFKL